MTDDFTDFNSVFMQPNKIEESEENQFQIYDEPYEYTQNSIFHSLYDKKLSTLQKEETEINQIFITLKTNQKCFELPPDQKDLETLAESDLNDNCEPIIVPDPIIKKFKVLTKSVECLFISSFRRGV